MYIHINNDVIKINNHDILFCVRETEDVPYLITIYKRDGTFVQGTIQAFDLQHNQYYFLKREDWQQLKNNIDFSKT